MASGSQLQAASGPASTTSASAPPAPSTGPPSPPAGGSPAQPAVTPAAHAAAMPRAHLRPIRPSSIRRPFSAILCRPMRPAQVIAERFEIERLAGSGGMGAVYRALDRVEGGVVALKVLHGTGEEHADRFVREARALAELRHPGIVKYVAHGRTPQGELYLAMEWLDGEDLSKRLARAGL